MTMSKNLIAMAHEYAAQFNPYDPDSAIDPATQFIQELLERGEDLQSWDEATWMAAAEEFGLEDADVSDFMECLAQWL
jgi:hypothetical protein